ncbi:MAG: M14 family murein peptide amidase A [Burkholderiaceae bacterium]
MSELVFHIARRVVACVGLSVLVTNLACASATASKPPVDWCKRFSDRLPTVSAANCASSALQPSGAASLRGFPILMRQIPAIKNGKVNNKAVRVLLLGGIHGDELTASAIVFHWMQWMKTSPAQDFYWDIVPVVNPDGLLASKPMRMNANGVDLNRNFPTPNWRTDAPIYWEKKTGKDPRRFPGMAPLSEPETRWVNQEMERFQPQVIISVHAPFGVLDFDGPAKPPHKFGRLILNPVGVYPGSLGNYSGMHKNVPVITIELPNAQAMPSETEIKRIWMDMLTWIQHNVPEKESSPNKRPVIAAK